MALLTLTRKPPLKSTFMEPVMSLSDALDSEIHVCTIANASFNSIACTPVAVDSQNKQREIVRRKKSPKPVVERELALPCAALLVSSMTRPSPLSSFLECRNISSSAPPPDLR
jgi:hypothetical protein